MGNLHACNELRERRPGTLRDDPPGEPSDRFEYLHFERFFVAWAALGLADHRGSQLTRPMTNSQARGREIDVYEVRRTCIGDLTGCFPHLHLQTSLNGAQDQVLDLLTHGWLQLEHFGQSSRKIAITLHECLSLTN